MRPLLLLVVFITVTAVADAQQTPYEITVPAEPPYFRVRYEGSEKEGELVYPATFTVWVPPGVKMLRGVVVHQHGCGEGSCKSGQTGAFDLHWQALAKKYDFALLSPVYEQPDKADCQLWCDPRNGSDVAFQRALTDLGTQSSHPELAKVPWALWGHSGGGHWAGGMLLLHADRVAAAWLRSGVPPLTSAEGKPLPYEISESACQVPVMCNVGTQEGVTVKDGRFSGVWPGVESFFLKMRAKGALVAVSVDPLSSHECGNQRYLAIPWLDACLAARLSETHDQPLKKMSPEKSFLAPLHADLTDIVAPTPASEFTGTLESSVWLPDATIAAAWLQYEKDSAVTDITPPPATTNLIIEDHTLTWQAEADVESGLASFIIERDGKFLANVPEQGRNPFGRPVFQNLQYSDTPTLPVIPMQFTDLTAEVGKVHEYRIIAVNTVGLKSK